jgi:hypothetical protein
MEKYKKYKEAFPNKTDAQCIESLCWEVSDKVETIHKLLEDKKYTEEDIREAIDMARQLSHVSCLEDGEHRLKYSNTEDDIINSLNKQD